MLDDKGKAVAEYERLLKDGKKKISPGKLDKVQTGNYVAYTIADKSKEVTVGKVISISRPEQNVIVHSHRPVTDGHLRLHWEPASKVVWKFLERDRQLR